MSQSDHPLSQEEFDDIFSKVPRLTIEIIVKNPEGSVYLTKRAIEPCKGQWHLPGGTVRFGEHMKDAVSRIAARELHIAVMQLKNVGYIEYPSHYNKGLDSPVGIVFEITKYSGELHPNNESQDGSWHSTLPALMHADQDVFLIDNGYVIKAYY